MDKLTETENLKSMYAIKVERDDDGYWGYDKTFDIYVTDSKEDAFNKVVDELRVMMNTIRGRNNYPERITEILKTFLGNIDNGDNYYYEREGNSEFNKPFFDICFNFYIGNSYMDISIIDIDVKNKGIGISYIYGN